jgi:hypothetical protein
MEFTMGNVVRFPKENPRACAHEEFEQNIRAVHDQIVDVTTEIVETVMFGCIQDFTVKISDEKGFQQDFAVFSEAIRSLLYRQFGYEHALHNLSDEGESEEEPST